MSIRYPSKNGETLPLDGLLSLTALPSAWGGTSHRGTAQSPARQATAIGSVSLGTLAVILCW